MSANDFLRNPNFSVDLLVDSNKQSHFSRTSADQMGEDNSYSVTWGNIWFGISSMVYIGPS